MHIDRCICTRQTFCDLIDRAAADGLSLKQVIEQTGAGANCTMWRPYLCRAYRTGVTDFGYLMDHDDEPPVTDADAKPAPLKISL